MNKLSKGEIIAVYKAADLMVMADGKIMPEEVVTVEDAMSKIGIDSLKELSEIRKKAENMSNEECYGSLAFLDFEQKKFVSSLLGAISSSDGDIDDMELELWRDLCEKCDLPVMNNRQAIEIFKNF